MSKRQYNLANKTDYVNRKMFLDPAGPVTIQRFEEVKYNKIADYEKTARGFFWVPEEINLTKDANDFKDASAAVKHIFTSNLLRQTALDSLQGRAPSQVFMPVISLPELEALIYNWTFFETNIHSRSYSHIIRNIYNVPKDVFNTIHDTKEIVDMAASVGRYYDQHHIQRGPDRAEHPVGRGYGGLVELGIPGGNVGLGEKAAQSPDHQRRQHEEQQRAAGLCVHRTGDHGLSTQLPNYRQSMAGGDLPPENKNTGGTLDMERIKELARAIVFALVGYRPQHVTPEMWDREYRDGQWEYLRKMDSIAGLVSILGYCDFLKPASILDAGCGEGLLAEKLKLLPYKSYLGMDVSREAIALATQNLGDARSQFVVADAWLFDTPERFDVIVFNQSLYYLTDPAGILKKYRALLNPGGRIIVSMVDNARTRAVWRLIDPVFGIEDAMTTTQGKGTVVTKVMRTD